MVRNDRVLDIEEREALALCDLCRTAETLDTLQVIVNRGGALADSSQGMPAHPALIELRRQRIAFARLVSAMQLTTGLTPRRQGGAQPEQPA